VVFEIFDTGAGMDEKALQQAFQPFFSTKGRDEKNGLGLTVVKALVAAMGGVVKLNSHKGDYTKLTIELPAAGRAEPSLSEEAARIWEESERPAEAVVAETAAASGEVPVFKSTEMNIQLDSGPTPQLEIRKPRVRTKLELRDS
jgi:hypothetical protein